MAALLPNFRIWLGRKIYGELSSGVVKISPGRIVKGPCHESELEAMEFVRSKTAIPVPKVYKAHHLRPDLYIEMEFVKGQDLESAWDDLTPEQKTTLIKTISEFVIELRALPPPEDQVVGSASQHKLRDARIGTRPWGPFKTHAGFHSLLRGHIPLDESTKTFGAKVVECHNRQYKTYFTHADLCMRNIIVRGDRIVSVIDWAFSGWYPEYWEFTKAHYGQFNIPDWYGPLGESIGRYDEELEAERMLWSKLDWPANQVQDL